MATHDSIEQRLNAPAPAAPSSEVPDLKHLQGIVGSRRRRRQTASSLAMVMMAGAAITVSVWQPTPGEPTQSTDSRTDPPAIIAPRPGVTAENLRMVHHREPQYRVFARVHDQVPVFGVHPESKQVEHLGWIESERAVPVDIDGISRQQQRSIEAVLRDDPNPLSL